MQTTSSYEDPTPGISFAFLLKFALAAELHLARFLGIFVICEAQIRLRDGRSLSKPMIICSDRQTTRLISVLCNMEIKNNSPLSEVMLSLIVAEFIPIVVLKCTKH